MTREEAISIIQREYSCVDRECNIERSCGKCDLMMSSKEPILEAYKMAIKTLEQEPKTKTGHWINNTNGTFECDQCGIKHSKSNYCPNCGAKMQEVTE